MSKSTSPTTPNDESDDEDKDLFQRLAEDYPDDELLQRLAVAMSQSSDSDSEVRNV
ncbi:hypothetical protein [Halobaculum marinum]|uniref:Kinesin n=1 Tax=Halobaculum marinum TaxID=3031996 RepID=A0ABD5WWZ1_9EURY|nr:hypothetical protein [Halobaculum sp. DT55]